MLRVTSGRFRGRAIDVPKARHRQEQVRPTTALVRESLFNSFQNRLAGCRFLDLFSGSGIMSIEALSRGAGFALSVEKNRDHRRIISENFSRLGITQAEAKTVIMDVMLLIARPNKEAPFDIVFLDPPYGLAGIDVLVANIQTFGWVSLDGVIAVENGSREVALEGFEIRDFGDTSLSIRDLGRALD